MKPVVLRWLYHEMLRVRLIEEAIAGLGSGRPACIGEEAVLVGSCFSLTPQDQVFSSRWSSGLYLAKSGDLKALLRQTSGKDLADTINLVDRQAGIPGISTISAVIEAASGVVQRGEKHVTVYFRGTAPAEDLALLDAL